MNLADTIRKTRGELGLSQTELALRSGVGLATVQNIEGNRGNPSLKTLDSIFKVLQIELKFERMGEPVNWSVLARLGCPILAKSEPALKDRSLASQSVTPTRSSLLEQLRFLASTHLRKREARAVASWLHAIRDHYPSVWQEIPTSLRAWAQNQETSPKLRRIALSHLGDFL